MNSVFWEEIMAFQTEETEHTKPLNAKQSKMGLVKRAVDTYLSRFSSALSKHDGGTARLDLLRVGFECFTT